MGMNHFNAFLPDLEQEIIERAQRMGTRLPPGLNIVDPPSQIGGRWPNWLSDPVAYEGQTSIGIEDAPIEKHCEEDEDRDWIKGALIGEGAFGQVYLGMDVKTGMLMAVKQARLPDGSEPDAEQMKARFAALKHEITVLQDLWHENIVKYLRSALDEDNLSIFLEYVPGGSVATLLDNYGAFEESLVRTFLPQILRGLEYLHAKAIIHCDIKGANVLVDNNGHIKISGFGISKQGAGRSNDRY
jgi:mitogen-activated protein kinase kinase kinase